MEKNDIEIINGNEISKVEYFFYEEKQNISKEKDNNINKPQKKLITPEMIKYNLIMEKDEEDKIIITINSKNENSITKYQTDLTIQNFIDLSPYFNLLYKLNSIFCIDNFFSFIKSKLDNSVNLTKKNIGRNNTNNNLINMNNSLIKIINVNNREKSDNINNLFLIFDIVYINMKKEEIKIPLKNIELINEKELVNIYQILLRNKYNYLQRIKYLSKKLLKTQTSLDKYQILLNKCNSYFDHDMQLKMSFLDLGIDTDIFDSPEQYNFIINILINLFSETNIYLEQIYKASCNGDNINSFHSNCDGIKNTLILIISDDKRKFGGFTRVEWDKSNKYKSDENAFLFSLDNYEVYPILDKYKEKAINCRENFYAPIFGNDLFIFDGFFSSRLNKAQENYFDYSRSKINEEYKLTGDKYFTVTEMEVYKINFFEQN